MRSPLIITLGQTLLWTFSNLIICSRFTCIRSLTSQTNVKMANTTTNEYTVSYVTIDSQEKAEKLASAIVDAELAACVNIVPQITSIYRWQGKIEKDNELLLIIKSRFSRLDELTEFVRKNHPYDVPEVISLPIVQGNPAYLKWIGDNVPEKQVNQEL